MTPGDDTTIPGGESGAVAGDIDPEIAGELPGLRIWTVTIEGRDGRSPRELREQLRALSDDTRGAQAIAQRTRPIPSAYRVFYRQVGLDPDRTRTPAEEATLNRLIAGEYRSSGLVADALLVALVETGIPLWAHDGDALHGPLRIGIAEAGTMLATHTSPLPLPAGRLVIGDARRTIGVLFGEAAADVRVTSRTGRITLVAIQVPGVPAIHVDEALYLAASLITGG